MVSVSSSSAPEAPDPYVSDAHDCRQQRTPQRGTTYGILKLTLHANSYDWQFVRAAGTGTFTGLRHAGMSLIHAAPAAVASETRVRSSVCRIHERAHQMFSERAKSADDRHQQRQGSPRPGRPVHDDSLRRRRDGNGDRDHRRLDGRRSDRKSDFGLATSTVSTAAIATGTTTGELSGIDQENQPGIRRRRRAPNGALPERFPGGIPRDQRRRRSRQYPDPNRTEVPACHLDALRRASRRWPMR